MGEGLDRLLQIGGGAGGLFLCTPRAMAARPAHPRPTRVSIDNSAMEYDAEKAYILATAVATPSRRVSRTSDEFDFSLTQSQLQSALRAAREGGHAEPLGEVAEEGDSTGLDPAEGEGEEEGETVRLKPLSSAEPKAENRVLVVYGPTGCGKSHLFRKLVHSNRSVFSPVISHTTRQRRETEINGVDFHFTSREDMETQIARGSFIEYIRIAGTRKSHPGLGKKTKRKKTRRNELVKAAKPLAGPRDGRLDSTFSLKEADKPSKGGEMFGTSLQALEEAKLHGKRCVILNMSPSGAHQLKAAGLQATFVLLCPEGKESEHIGDIQPDYTIATDSFDRAFSELQQFAFGLVEDLQTTPGTTRDVTEDEWRVVPTWKIDPEGTEREREITHKPPRIVTFNELLVHCQESVLSRHLAALHQPKEEKARKKKSFGHLFSGGGKAKLSKKLKRERNLIFDIAQCPLNDQEGIHLQALQTIYRQLTGSPSPGRYGRHWEDVGFLGMDPADDLRGVGFLGLMQLVNLLENPRTLPLAREMYRQSRSTEKEHSIPFCMLSLNLTQVALNSLREGYLSQLCNKRDQVFVLLNEYHIAMLYHYFHIWKTQSKTIGEVGTLIQEVGQYAQRNTKALLRDVETYLDSFGPRSAAGHGHQEATENPFTTLDQLQQFADITIV